MVQYFASMRIKLITYRFHVKQVQAMENSMLYDLGINDKICIYSYNRKEWYACYIGAQFINSVAVGVYHTCSSDEVEWIVSNSDSKIVFVGNNPNDNDQKEKICISENKFWSEILKYRKNPFDS